ncbi:hypothetical protein GCM10027190_17030 [Spirosoma areae]
MDKFNGTVRLHIPLGYRKEVEGKMKSFYRNATFSKSIRNGVSTYYISLTAYADKSYLDATGVIILLDNGQKINLPDEEIDIHENEFTDLHNGE